MSAMTEPGRIYRPLAAYLAMVVLIFLGVSALGGGYAMATGYTPPRQWLDAIPALDSWTVPALVLGLGFGAGSLAVAYGVASRPHWPFTKVLESLTRHHWAWSGMLLLGAGQLAWIVLELVYLPEVSVLQAVYGTTGLALLLLPLHPDIRRYLSQTPAAG